MRHLMREVLPVAAGPVTRHIQPMLTHIITACAASSIPGSASGAPAAALRPAPARRGRHTKPTWNGPVQ